MKRQTAGIAVIALCIVLASCLKSENPDVPKSIGASASCNECHPYPGSSLCKTDTVVDAGGMASTKCSACHAGSIKLDSSYDPVSMTFVYHDAMFDAHGVRYPLTDSTHTDGSKTLNFNQCTYCHSFPPNTTGHKIHVTDRGKSCFECHFATIKSDTGYDSSTVPPAMYFTQRMKNAPGGVSLPWPDQSRHIDNSVEVVFMRKYQRPAPPDSMFNYNRFDRSCSNIACHSGTANGGASVERTLWQDPNQ